MGQYARQRLFNADCMDLLRLMRGQVRCVFADPPDNIGLQYGAYRDRLSAIEYRNALEDWIHAMLHASSTVWLSFNARWTIQVACITSTMQAVDPDMEMKPCIQTFAFGRHNKHDFGNCHRPLWRFTQRDAPIYPDQIRIESWRQQHGDPRANPDGKVPGDVFDFPRVTGNSKQRRAWIPTQLHEGLVERCILSSTKEGEWVLDPFAGSGTVARVCKRLNRSCISVEIDPDYCKHISEENDIEIEELPGGMTVCAKKDPRFLEGQACFLDED